MNLTEEQKEFLLDNRNVKERYRQLVYKYVDEPELPANVVVLFEHIMANKAKNQTAHMIGLDIYFVDYKPTVWRKYYGNGTHENGWHIVEHLSRPKTKNT